MQNLKSLIMYAVILIAPGLGGFILNHFTYPLVVYLYFIALLIAIIVFTVVSRKPRYKVERENLDAPTKLQNYHEELLALGFERDCLLIVTYLLLPQRQWVYWNRDEKVYAYINEPNSLLWFSSYLEQNFDISTRFQHGMVSNNRKMTSHIVKTSIPAAYDYHLQYRQQYQPEYGDFLLFENMEAHLEWERKQNLPKEIEREFGIGCFKLVGRSIVGIIVLFVIVFLMGMPVTLYLQINFSAFVAKAMQQLWLMWFFGIGGLAGFFWLFWPTWFPKSVEERKKKEFLN